MTTATPPVAALDRALAAKIDADGELDLLRERLAEERDNLAQADAAARTAGLASARSGLAADKQAAREALALKAEVERDISQLTDILIPEAEEAKARASEALAEARRTACADEAEAECEAVARRLAEEYPELIQRLTDLKVSVAAADAKAVAANRDLPVGRSNVLYAEAQVRDIPAQRGGKILQEVVSVWCYAGTLEPIPEDRLGEIQKTSRDRRSGETHFILPSRSTHSLSAGRQVELKRLLRVTMEERSELRRGSRLADMSLPPLRPNVSEARRWTELRELAGDAQDEGEGQ
ncbi:hypothetical protein [Brevundimonas subvibrioides]|uniref:hypothetical protein n=1 Tax=Brevundimonas subvibrioides TaxID=74313 RepID=UPI0022B3D2DF|nr:hypothetical protein [Brevundimonas subvibrioides]